MSGYTEASPTFSRPHVSYIEDEDLVIYDDVQPEKDWSKEYLTLEALTPGKFNYTHQTSDVGNMYFSRDNGNTWTSMGTIIDGIDVQSGDKVMFKASEVFSYDNACGKFSSTCQFNAMGNPRSVLFGDNFADVPYLPQYAFKYMFRVCTGLTSAGNLSLPVTKLDNDCYVGMFAGCTSLTTAPELPATTLKFNCYGIMFEGCTSLTTAPALPATTLADSCYDRMFQGCTSLNYVKMLATDVSATNCLNNWLDGVSATGTFVKHPNANLPSGIPAGWTVETATE